MSLAVLAVGLVLIVEGLALALAPSRFQDLLAAFAALPRDRRRLVGLVALAAGLVLVWLARRMGA
jgi:hypothetical protein